ncbi:hypothetical protein CJI97_001699 [Candidozyma auris]|nr:hypothetical protein CJI97_001699 [[Candida] auris]
MRYPLCLLALLVSLICSLLPVSAGVVSKEPTSDEGRSSLNDVKNKNILPLDLRSLQDWKLTDLLLVSDIDGNLHAVERNTGASLWTLPLDEPLVRVSRNRFPRKDPENDTNLLWLVEPYQDGSLYYFTPQFGLNKLPTTIKNLVMEAPFSLSGDNKIYTGVRKTSLYTINMRTGEVLNQFGSADESCPAPNLYKSPNFSPDSQENTIMLGKTTYELSVHYKYDSSVVWNITYSSWGPNNIDNDLIMQNGQSIDDLYFTPFHDKSLLAINKGTGTPQWICRLPSLAVNVFDVFNNEDNPNQYVTLPHPLKVLNDLQHLDDAQRETPNNDLCFVNRTANGKEWFAMSFKNYPTLLKSAPIAQYQMALYQFATSTLDRQTQDFLSRLNVSREDVEPFINGVHKINHLTPDSMYQPHVQFRKEEYLGIGDGSESSGHSENESKQVPHMIDGILFPYTSDEHGSALATIDEMRKEVIANDRNYPTGLPARHSDMGFPSDSNHRLSIFRRIAEDIIVLAVLLLVLFSAGKLNGFLQFTKGREYDLAAKTGDVELKLHPTKSTRAPVITETEERSVEEKPLPTIPKESTEGAKDKVVTAELDDDEKVKAVFEDSKKKVRIVSEEQHKDDAGAPTPEVINGQEPEPGIVTKKKRKRGSRGGKRGGKGKKTTESKEDDDPKDEASENTHQASDDSSIDDTEAIATKSLVKQFTKKANSNRKLQIDNNLIISDKILGYGSHGTVVYEGTFENRPVAVKRMLLDFYDIANHEVRLLQESDDHPNVVRYFCSQSSESEKFLYIALELCVCSLEDLVEKPKVDDRALRLDHHSKNEVLLQLVSGLHYLHSLKIVHRDLKPQNILVGDSTKKKKSKLSSEFRLLISDFGLCKKLDADQSSFRATTQHAASGTSGWRAPELLLHHDLMEISPDTVSSLNSTSKHSIKDGLSNGGSGKRLTKAIDIFSLGCVFYYILTGGGHPFGDRYLREGNIVRGEYDLSALKQHCPYDWVEATHLIASMISFNPKTRPDTAAIMKHPYFWNYSKKLEFLLKVSDRFEIEKRDPPSPLLLSLESTGHVVHQGDWLAKFDQQFIDNLGKYRKYNTDKVMDLLRALRNKYHHFNDMPPDLQVQLSPLPIGFYTYFNRKFPKLLMETYKVVDEEGIKDEHVFESFYSGTQE